MNAIIFSAGLGTRLQPLTNNTPKALIKLNGKPLVWHAIHKLIEIGATKIIVNVHHFGDQVIDYLKNLQTKVQLVISDERNELLDTGGGLLFAQNLFDENTPIIAYNVDIISSVNLIEAIKFHKINSALATLIVRNRDTSRYLMFDNVNNLTGWKNIITGEEKIATSTFNSSKPYAFSGIQILSPSIFKYITEKGKFSIIDLYLRLGQHHEIKGFIDESDFWLDLGKPGQIELAEKYLNLNSNRI